MAPGEWAATALWWSSKKAKLRESEERSSVRAPQPVAWRGLPPAVEDELGVHLPEVEVGAAAEFVGDLAADAHHVLERPFVAEFVEGVARVVAERGEEIGGQLGQENPGQHGGALAVGEAERALGEEGVDEVLAGLAAAVAIRTKGHESGVRRGRFWIGRGRRRDARGGTVECAGREGNDGAGVGPRLKGIARAADRGPGRTQDAAVSATARHSARRLLKS